MRFRPCIDIHNGSVKQIVGGSLRDKGDSARENFVSKKGAAFYAKLYRNMNLSGGHIIILNPSSSAFYEKDVNQALDALAEWPDNLQIGGGINPKNAAFFLDKGASQVIVTSYVFSDGIFCRDRLKKMVDSVGKDRLVLDLSCRKKNDAYYIVTDRWQKFTEHKLTAELLLKLTDCCGEFLIHAADAEGKAAGIDKDLAALLSQTKGFPTVYAGGARSADDIRLLKKLGKNRLDISIGSALSIFGGNLKLEDVLSVCEEEA